MKLKYMWVSLLALCGCLFLFLCVGLPAWTNYGYFAGDLDRYGEMKFEFPMIVLMLVCSVGFVIDSIVGAFK